MASGTQRSDRDLYERFGRRARQQPDVAAVREPDGKHLTYGGLERQAAVAFVATNRCSKHEPSSNCALRVSDRGPHEHHLLGHDEGATPGGSCI